MKLLRPIIYPTAVLSVFLVFAGFARSQAPFAAVSEEVNKKMVKLYGAGGFRGVAAYGTGVLVSPDGYILTADSVMLDTQDLRVHLYDGRVFHQAKVIVREPALDAALIKIDKVEDLPFFDVTQAAKAPLAQSGDWILGFSNQFHIATRDEPMSVQRGTIASYSKLHGRRGIFEAPYSGEVYVIDAITNNPGAGGGAITTRKGELLGIIGKELRNSLTDTWMNYAVPIQALAKFVEEAKEGKYKIKERPKTVRGKGVEHGIILVPNVVERTPPFINEVLPNSPAARAGLKPDDLIVYIDGEQVISVKSFLDMMSKIEPGTVLKLEVQRVVDKQSKREKLVSVELKVEAKPEKPAPPVKETKN